MPDNVRITLLPLGHEITVQKGTPLRDVLFPYGVEFPCGGNAICEGCKVKVVSGNLPLTQEQENMLSVKEAKEGWRLACRCKADEDMTLELAQWEARILADESRFDFKPRDGFGIAVDLGTTTLAAQLLDLKSGNVIGVETGLNDQGRYGADVMTRVFFAVTEKGQPDLELAIRKQLGGMIEKLVASSKVDPGRVLDVAIVGNTVMHHLFSGLDVGPLSQYPFESPTIGFQVFESSQLGWNVIPNATVRFLPCLGSFVGSDILAGILATNLHKSDSLVGLIDLGTNGEIVIGNRDKFLFCSTAAGPAFEGSCISMGMRATTGAIVQVFGSDGKPHCRVLGNVEPRGICGSGLVDAVAVGLSTQRIREDGKVLEESGVYSLCPPVNLTQGDIRELQVAKAAIAAGIQILAKDLGATVADISKVYLAGAFGNYIDRSNAYRIGLLPVQPEKIQPAGNTALLGAKLALFHSDPNIYATIKNLGQHVALNLDEQFQDIFINEMGFPEVPPVSSVVRND
ncbi:MAG: ASKHA domain-containing protein [Ignavibacteriales bacterium]|nr:ASKHA domain-containing protein [Ignavibacteriales bacterium]